jgi:hypothetical protein
MPRFRAAGSDLLDIEQLTREEIHAGEHHHRKLTAFFSIEIDDVFRCEL